MVSDVTLGLLGVRRGGYTLLVVAPSTVTTSSF